MDLQRVCRPEGPQDWEAQRAVITDLYITQGLELEVLMKTMERDHFFKATKKQYKTYFTKWDLRKNVRPSEYSAMIKKRRKREEEGKGSVFRLRGALVDDSKIVRYEKRTKTGDEHEIAEVGTPEELSCFTPSPVANSPIVPSVDLPHFKSPNLLRTSIVSPSERALLAPSPRLLSPESPDHEVYVEYCEFVSEDGDIFEMVTFQRMDHLERGSFHLSSGFNGLRSPLHTLMNCLNKWAHKQEVVNSRIWESTLLHSLRSLKPNDSFTELLCVVRPEIFTSTDSRTLIFQLKPSPLPRYQPGSVKRFTLFFFGDALYQTRVKRLCSITFDLEQKHNPGSHRSGSCESIESTNSFRTDSVVDWKELLHGYNQ